ncbi:MAG TPA: response regulator [Nitrososphaeraceae archaeon]|nr:response regulator [Nitrososphaeraceae archaeon]
MRILIAEDDPVIWTPYKITLEKRGHTVDIAENGEECIERYKTALKDEIRQKKNGEGDYYNYHYRDYSSKRRTNSSSSSSSSDDHTLSSSSLLLPPLPPPPFDAVVLDYRMPKKDGLAVAKEILALNPSQRIIFASAYVKETLRESVKELRQVVELMQKPFLPEALVDVVEDTEAYPELKKLFVNVRKMSEIDFENPTPNQIRDIFEGLKKIQKGRTF